MIAEVKLARGILSGEIVIDHADSRVDEISRALLDAHEQLERHDAAAIETQKSFSAAQKHITAQDEKIATRDALVKSQSECIERLRIVIRELHAGRTNMAVIASLALQPGDMGEAT